MNDRDTNLERLIRHAAEADRFAGWVDGGAQDARAGWGRGWRLGGGIAAAAAAFAVGFLLLRPTPAPRPGAPVATNTAPVVIEPVTRGDAPVVTLAAQPTDLSAWFHLAPDAEDGIPSLTDDRSVLLAVYHNTDASCGCLAWRLADDARLKQARTAVLNEAISSPCRLDAGEVTVYAVSGPRYLLPFHEEDAQRLAQCLASNPEECITPDAALDQVASGAGAESSLPDLAASALAMCVPSGLRVTSVTMPLAVR